MAASGGGGSPFGRVSSRALLVEVYFCAPRLSSFRSSATLAAPGLVAGDAGALRRAGRAHPRNRRRRVPARWRGGRDEAGIGLIDGPRRREAAGRPNPKDHANQHEKAGDRALSLARLSRPPENKADLHMGPFLAACSPNTPLVQCVGYGVQAARPGFLDFSNQRQQICGKLIGAALAGGRPA
jgi:hypothetical protein